MATFKPGDQVKRIGNDHTSYGTTQYKVFVGEVYTVSHMKQGMVCLEGMGTYGFEKDKFTLVTPQHLGEQDIIKGSMVSIILGDYAGNKGKVEAVEDSTHDTLCVLLDGGNVSTEISRAYLRLQSTTQPKGSNMNTVIARLFAKAPTEDAVLVQKYFGVTIAQNDVSFIILDGKQKELLAKAKELEAKANEKK